MGSLPFQKAALSETEPVGAAKVLERAPQRSEIRGDHRLPERFLELADDTDRVHAGAAHEQRIGLALCRGAQPYVLCRSQRDVLEIGPVRDTQALHREDLES